MPLLTVAQAFELVMQHRLPVRKETVPWERAAGRILAQAVRADRDYPPINRATMDGIAVKLGSARAWSIESTIAAGQPAHRLRDAKHGCIKIMTGAEVPENADTVIPFEDIVIEGSQAHLRKGASPRRRQNVHAKSLDRKKGAVLLAPGILLDAPRVAITAACGYAKINVAAWPLVSIISTGNEIVPVESKNIKPGQSRISNLAGLAAGLARLGIYPAITQHVADNQAAINKTLRRAITKSEVVIITGGMSKGDYDYVPGILESLGVKKIFHGVAQKPGKPFWFGKTRACRVFGLPGNPVSTLAVFYRYIAPFLMASAGSGCTAYSVAELNSGFKSHDHLTLFVPATRALSGNGTSVASVVEYHGSGDLTALAGSNGFVEIPPRQKQPLRGCCFPFYSWD